MTKKGHQKFWPWKWKLFPKKTSFTNLGPRKKISVPQTRRLVSATGRQNPWAEQSSEQTRLNIISKLFWSSQACLQCAWTIPLWMSTTNVFKGAWRTFLNINLSESQCFQSTLPIGMGELGIRGCHRWRFRLLATAAGTLCRLQSNLLNELVSHPGPHV